MQGGVAAHHALAVVSVPGQGHIEVAFGVETALGAVIQAHRLQAHILLRRNQALELVVQPVERQLERTVGQYATGIAVVQLTARHRQFGNAGNFTPSVVHFANGQVHGLARIEQPGLTVIQLVTLDLQLPNRSDAATSVIQAPHFKLCSGLARDATVSLVVQAGSIECQRLVGGKQPGLIQQTG